MSFSICQNHCVCVYKCQSQCVFVREQTNEQVYEYLCLFIYTFNSKLELINIWLLFSLQIIFFSSTSIQLIQPPPFFSSLYSKCVNVQVSFLYMWILMSFEYPHSKLSVCLTKSSFFFYFSHLYFGSRCTRQNGVLKF